MTGEILRFETRRPPTTVGPLAARLDHPQVRSGGASGPLLSATLTLPLNRVSPDQREALTRLLQSGRPVTLTLAPAPGENPDPAKSPGEGSKRPAPSEGLPR